MKERIEKLFNDQIQAELYSAYLYLSMSAYFESQNLPGFANWMRIQFQEEQAHGLGMFDYVSARGGKVALQEIEAPKVEWKNAVEVFEDTLEHERYVTGRINQMADAAIEEKDHAAVNFLQWYIKEQVEEEATAEKLLFQLRLLEGKGQGMLMLDRELAQRTFVAPVIA